MNGFGVSPLELMASDAMLQGLVYLDEFVYSADWLKDTDSELGSMATVEQQIQINGDSDFIVQEQNITAFASGDYVDDPNILVTITRAGSGREIMNQAQHVLNYFGSYGRNKVPGRKPMSGLIQANNTLTVKLQNLDTTDYDRVDVAFIGFKVFYTTSQVTGHQGSRQVIFHAM